MFAVLLPGHREFQATVFAYEQRPAEELLQLDNLSAYRARGDFQLGCCTRNAAMSRNRFKGDKSL